MAQTISPGAQSPEQPSNINQGPDARSFFYAPEVACTPEPGLPADFARFIMQRMLRVE